MIPLPALVLVLFQFQVPPPRGYVNDFAGVLDARAVARMDSGVAALRARTGAEIAVVTLADLGGRPAAEVAVRIGREWGVGAEAAAGDPRRNLGVVILLKPLENGRRGTGELFIATGRGAEGVLTDARTGRIRDAMLPYLAREDYAGGLATGVELVASALEEAATGARAPAPARGNGRPRIPLIVIVVLLVIALQLFAAFRGSRRRGPRWGRRRGRSVWIGGWPGGRGGWGGGRGGGGFGGGFGGFGGGGGFSGGGAGGKF